MRRIVIAALMGGMVFFVTGCGGKEAKSDANQEKETIEMETVSNDLDSTRKHIQELDAALKDALGELDLED